jgi:hypothetical protein
LAGGRDLYALPEKLLRLFAEVKRREGRAEYGKSSFAAVEELSNGE